MKIIISIISVIITVLLIGCGGGGSGGNDTVTNTASSSSVSDTLENPLNSQSFTLDESDFIDTSTFTVLQGTAADENVTLELKNSSNALSISSTDVTRTRSTADDYSYPTTLSEESVRDYIGKALLIDGAFAGMIERFENGTIIVKNAENISDVYSRFDVSGSLASVEQNVQAAVRRSLGKYDAMNAKPLKISVVQKEVSSQTRAKTVEPVLIVEFPQGYTIPLTRAVNCDLGEAMCDAQLQYDEKYPIDINKEASFGSVTFTTAGSRIEIGLGAYLRAMYDYNAVSDNQYLFEFKPSAYYKVTMQMAITGSSISAAEKTFKIFSDGFSIPIPLYSKLVTLNLNLVPEIVLGMESAPNNKDVTFKASLESERSGYVRLSYSNAGGSMGKSIQESADPLVKSAITLHVDTGEDKIVGYLFPEIALRPQLQFAKISKKVTIAYVRNGARIDTKIKGVVKDDWIVENTEITGSTVEDVFLKTYLYGLIDYKWDVKVGDTDIVSSDDWSEIYKSDTLNILEWMSQFLQEPTVNIEIKDKKRHISFDIESKYKKNIRFYYTLDGSDIDASKINDNRDTVYTIWRSGDEDIILDEDKTVKVRAVLFTDEIPEKANTLWVWGMSISKQAKTAAVYVPEPVLNPTARDFKETLNISLSQSEGDEIRTSQNGGLSYNTCGNGACSVTLSDSADLYAIAVREFEGEEYNSKAVLGYYRKCDSHEAVGSAGKCVTQCPYLWDITYSESGEFWNKGLGEDLELITTGTTKFYNILIEPETCDNDFSMSTFEREVCDPYKNNVHLGSNSHYGECHSPTGGMVPDGFAGEAYLDGNVIHMFNDLLCTEGSSDDKAYLHVHADYNICDYGAIIEFNVNEDFAPKIVKKQSFSMSADGVGGTFTFTPRDYQKQSSSSSTTSYSSSESSSSSSSSVDNQSDNDEDNGENVDGSLEEQNTPSLWRFHVVYTHPEYGSGTFTAENIEINFDAPVGAGGTKMFAIHDTSTCGGELASCGSLLIYSGYSNPNAMIARFEAKIYTVPELGFEDVTSDEFVVGNNGFVCDGTIPASFNANSGSTKWSWNSSYQSCSYTLEPMQ
jgi:flagellar hook assembly protein FlgD